MRRSVATTMGVRAGARALLVDAPDDVVAGLGLPELAVPGPDGEVDHVHLFVVTAERLREALDDLRGRLAPRGALWVSWPKGRRLGTDLALPRVIEIAYDAGLVESTCLRVDDTWAGLRLSHPKPGKRYANSYGTLPWQRG